MPIPLSSEALHANVHEIGSHIPVVADRYPWISPSCGFDIDVILYLKTHIQSIIIIVFVAIINYTW